MCSQAHCKGKETGPTLGPCFRQHPKTTFCRDFGNGHSTADSGDPSAPQECGTPRIAPKTRRSAKARMRRKSRAQICDRDANSPTAAFVERSRAYAVGAERSRTGFRSLRDPRGADSRRGRAGWHKPKWLTSNAAEATSATVGRENTAPTETHRRYTLAEHVRRMEESFRWQSIMPCRTASHFK